MCAGEDFDSLGYKAHSCDLLHPVWTGIMHVIAGGGIAATARPLENLVPVRTLVLTR